MFHVLDHPSFSTDLISKDSHLSSLCVVTHIWVFSLKFDTNRKEKEPYTSLACTITVNNARQTSKKMNHTLLMFLPLQVYFIDVCDQ